MNVEEIRELVQARGHVVTHGREELAGLDSVIVNSDILDYLAECLPESSFLASGVNVLELRGIQDNVAEGCSPGGYILPFGYLVVAVDVGGNGVCLGVDGHAYWADHTAFTTTITYHNLATAEWEDLGSYTPENVKRALVPLSDDLEAFLKELLTDRLEETLEEMS